MQRNLHPGGLSVTASALALALGFISLPSARAQDPEPKPEVPAPEEPKEITSADFAIQANAVEDRLSQIQNEMSVIDVADEVNAALDEIEAEGTALQEQFNALETRRMMISELNALRVQLELLDARTKRQIDKLSVYAGDLEELETQNDQDIEVWTRAVRAVRKPSIPKSVRDRTASILQGLREGRKELDKKLGEALALQTRALDVRDSVHMAEQGVMLAQREQTESIFERQDPPLWSTEPRPTEEAEREGYEIRFSWLAVTSHLRAERGMLLLQLFLVLALGWAFVRVRASLAARIDKHQQDGGIPWEGRALDALRHPWAAALLLVLASVRFLYPVRVVDMILLTWVVALPLWFVVYKEMVPAVFRNALVGLGLLGTIHIVVTMVSGHPAVERALLLLELVLVCAGAGWLIHFLRNVDVPRRVRQGLWFSLTSLWTRLALLISAIGVGATVLGYTYLATEIAIVAIIGTIVATAWMALARIVEAVVSSAVYTGRLDGFRMIRANRDIATKTLSRVVRLAATALFLWSLADMTTVWRPMGRVLGRAVSADLGLGFATTGVTFGDLGAFFIILWLSWMLARFVSFVLREELLPRLHVKEGVPFALTTFTRYAIIAIGFIAAVSVLGIPLDKLTIVLSALGVGIGFGLQGLVNNVVSGFVLLTERPIRLRDKIEIEGVLGHVSDIGIRASTIRTFDGAEVIVPNGDLISGRVVNWTLSARQQRVTIPVGVAYGTDPNQVLDILRKVAAADEKVFKDPAPLALFRGFGESSLDFELRIFMDPADVLNVPSAVTVAINEALKEAGIEIPFPQRDLYLRGVPEGFVFAGTDTDTEK
jgi:small-conductance mechanosensitive channel